LRYDVDWKNAFVTVYYVGVPLSNIYIRLIVFISLLIVVLGWH
jgi:hypothetical protein